MIQVRLSIKILSAMEFFESLLVHNACSMTFIVQSHVSGEPADLMFGFLQGPKEKFEIMQPVTGCKLHGTLDEFLY